MKNSGMYLGIDLGTSSMKIMLLDREKGVVETVSQPYSVEVPQTGWAQQNVEVWWNACKLLLARLKAAHPKEFEAVSAVGLSGQMHGAVCLDAEYQPVYPAILWLDQRSAHQTEKINRMFGEAVLRNRIHNRISVGFALPSIFWLKECEPEVFRKVRYVAAPKDYIRMKLTGMLGTEASDASASGFFDVSAGMWAEDLVELLELNAGILPQCATAAEVAGTVTPDCGCETGLPCGIPVVYGAGDHQAQCIGNGVCAEGKLIVNLGTGGQVSSFSAQDCWDQQLRTHTFRHALPDSFVVFGATLASGLSLSWFSKTFLGTADGKAVSELAALAPAGSGGLLYLPYLAGERTPHMDPAASGMFFGIKTSHDKRYFARAILEGVTFSLLQAREVLDSMGLRGEQIIASGGGAKSSLWLQMLADVFGREILVSKEEEQGCLGACILAAVGLGDYPDINKAAELARYRDARYTPSGCEAVYLEQYHYYKQLYESNRRMMHELNKSVQARMKP